MKMMMPSGLDLVEGTSSAAGASGSDALTESRALSVAGPRKQLLLTFVNRIRLDFATTCASSAFELETSALSCSPPLRLHFEP